jgi:hypothetical protein
MEEELAANTVEYAVDTAWYVSMVEVVCKNIRMRGRCVQSWRCVEAMAVDGVSRCKLRISRTTEWCGELVGVWRHVAHCRAIVLCGSEGEWCTQQRSVYSSFVITG